MNTVPNSSGIRIGKLQLNGNIILSPMAGITDSPFRQICQEMGAALTISEMLTSDLALWNTQKSKLRRQWDGKEYPKCIQIAGSDPKQMAMAAEKCEELGADIIDINMGCPAKKVCKKWSGSALMQDEPLSESILKSVVQAVTKPVTLKTRLGWNTENKNILNIAKIAENSGIQMISIHGRTRCQGYKGTAEYDLIKQVKEALAIPVIANGDIVSEKKAKQVLDLTKSDGIMLGRVTQGNPWAFKSVNDFLRTGKTNQGPTLDERRSTVLKHLRLIHQFYGESAGVRMARKHVGWYTQHLNQSVFFRKKFNLITKATNQERCVQEYFEQLIEGEVKLA